MSNIVCEDCRVGSEPQSESPVEGHCERCGKEVRPAIAGPGDLLDELLGFPAPPSVVAAPTPMGPEAEPPPVEAAPRLDAAPASERLDAPAASEAEPPLSEEYVEVQASDIQENEAAVASQRRAEGAPSARDVAPSVREAVVVPPVTSSVPGAPPAVRMSRIIDEGWDSGPSASPSPLSRPDSAKAPTASARPAESPAVPQASNVAAAAGENIRRSRPASVAPPKPIQRASSPSAAPPGALSTPPRPPSSVPPSALGSQSRPPSSVPPSALGSQAPTSARSSALGSQAPTSARSSALSGGALSGGAASQRSPSSVRPSAAPSAAVAAAPLPTVEARPELLHLEGVPRAVARSHRDAPPVLEEVSPLPSALPPLTLPLDSSGSEPRAENADVASATPARSSASEPSPDSALPVQSSELSDDARGLAAALDADRVEPPAPVLESAQLSPEVISDSAPAAAAISQPGTSDAPVAADPGELLDAVPSSRTAPEESHANDEPWRHNNLAATVQAQRGLELDFPESPFLAAQQANAGSKSPLRRFAPLGASALGIGLAIFLIAGTGKKGGADPHTNVAAATPEKAMPEVKAEPKPAPQPPAAPAAQAAVPATTDASKTDASKDTEAAAPTEKFNGKVAHRALLEAMDQAKACKKRGDPAGIAQATIRFDPAGTVSDVKVTGARIAGTPMATCIADAFEGTKVPPFIGKPVTVKRNLRFK